MQINEITTTIIIVISILTMTSGTGILDSLVFAQNDSEDSETDLSNMTLTNSSEVVSYLIDKNSYSNLTIK
jgi:hypothetical protein